MSVQALALIGMSLSFLSFNTSYVSVQAYIRILDIFGNIRFNTSYVSVQDIFADVDNKTALVSIHPMCRFKKGSMLDHLGLSRFQYILCVGSSI